MTSTGLTFEKLHVDYEYEETSSVSKRIIKIEEETKKLAQEEKLTENQRGFIVEKHDSETPWIWSEDLFMQRVKYTENAFTVTEKNCDPKTEMSFEKKQKLVSSALAKGSLVPKTAEIREQKVCAAFRQNPRYQERFKSCLTSIGQVNSVEMKIKKEKQELVHSLFTDEPLIQEKAESEELRVITSTKEEIFSIEKKIERKRQKFLVQKSSSLTDLLVQKKAELQNLQTSTASEELRKIELDLAEEQKTRIKCMITPERVDYKKAQHSKLKAMHMRDELERIEAEIYNARARQIEEEENVRFLRKQKLLEKMLKKYKSLDLVFMVDCTGSMAPYINEVKEKIGDVVSFSKETYDNNIRLSFVGYRDHSDGDKRIEAIDFTDDLDVFREFVSHIVAKGGDDACEDVLGGLEYTGKLDWKSKNRIVFHIGDAPQHGAEFHDGCGDSYIEGCPRGVTATRVFRSFRKLKLKYFFGKINSSTDKMFFKFQELHGESNAKQVELHNHHLLLDSVMESVSSTITETMSQTMDALKLDYDFNTRSNLDSIPESHETSLSIGTLKDYSISENKPAEIEFQDYKSCQWLICQLIVPASPKLIKDHVESITHVWSQATVRWAKDPFAEGAQRISYHGKRRQDLDVWQIVLKEFKKIAKQDCRSEYISIMETQCVADYLASEFNKKTPAYSKNLRFLEVSVLQEIKPDGAPFYYNTEPLLPDYAKFTKWNSNLGYLNREEPQPLLQAFSHWTYEATDRFLMVVDLQGVEREEEFGLTDPCILCIKPYFGRTNLGKVGIKEFFRLHNCNSICQQLGLKDSKSFLEKTKSWIGY